MRILMGIKWQFTVGPEAILETQLLMLASHNILNPANGAPITVPSQDMVWVYIYEKNVCQLRKEDFRSRFDFLFC
jgi:DNA-directed RNA polymerase beta' subunit